MTTETETGSARDKRLKVVRQQPFNAETPLAEQIGLLTPTPLFYVRSNFNIPRLDAGQWRLTVGGEVEHATTLTYEELLTLPSRSLLVTLECAGNGRSSMEPQPEGEPWQFGAAGTAEWTGVPLHEILAAAAPTAAAREIVIEGADRGTVALREGKIPFARALTMEQALHPDTLLAYAMNGEALTPDHGFPLRLIVPGWYGMAAVKWITRIEAIATRFDGYYQVDRYILDSLARAGAPQPLTAMRVRSLITSPAEGVTLSRGPHRLRGLAWSGAAPVTRVEVSVDGGAGWAEAALVSEAERYAWRRWEFLWHAETAGLVTLLCSRAYDADGNAQPTQTEWNRLGYANNAIQSVSVTVH